MDIARIHPKTHVRSYSLIVMTLISLTCLFLASFLQFEFFDLQQYFLPATREFLHLRNPYTVTGYYNPPWTLLFLTPFLALPASWIQPTYFYISLGALGWVCYKLNMKKSSTLAFLTSLPVVSILVYGNIEWLTLLGMFLPPQIGLFFVLMKPQVGIGIAIWWIIEAYKKGWKEIIHILWPITLVLSLSIIVYGPWPLNVLSALETGVGGGLPWTIPLAFYTLVRMKNVEDSLLIGPALSPHMMGSSWCGLFIVLSDTPWAMWAANIGMWAWVIFT